jgi:hypothetical protein
MFAKRLTFLALAVSAAALLFVGPGCTIETDDAVDETDTDLIGDEDTEPTNDEDTGEPEPFDSGMDVEDTGMSGDDGGDVEGDGDAEEMCEEACCFFPDNCPDAEQCFPPRQPGGDRSCQAFDDSATAGDSCEGPGECGEGQICSPVDGVCSERCDPNAEDSETICKEDVACTPVAIGRQDPQPTDVGICTCSSYPNDSCGEGQNCYRLQTGGSACFEYDDTASVGDDCQRSTECNNAQICFQGECRDKCTQQGDGPCDGGQCQPLQDADGNRLDFGVCPK